MQQFQNLRDAYGDPREGSQPGLMPSLEQLDISGLSHSAHAPFKLHKPSSRRNKITAKGCYHRENPNIHMTGSISVPFTSSVSLLVVLRPDIW
eukprot:1381988-Amphidinium_carterae.1